MNRKSRKGSLFLAALGVSFIVPAAFGQTVNWAGTDSGDWNDGNNWSPTGVPGSSSIADFNGGGSGNTNITLDGAGATIGAIQFDSGSASSYDLGITAGDSFTINNANISSSIGAIAVTSSVANSQEIDASIALTSASPLITDSSTAGLTLGALNTTATLSDSAATPTGLSIKFLSASPTSITINDAITGNIGGSTTVGIPGAGAAGTATGGLSLTGTTNVSSVLTLNGQNTYTGITNLNASGSGNPVTVLIGSNSAFGNSTLVPNAGTQTPLEAFNADRTISNTINMVGGGFTVADAAAGAHNLSFTGPMTFSSGQGRTITINTFGQTFTLGASPGSNTLTLASSAATGAAFNLAMNPGAVSADGSKPATLILNDIVQDLGTPAIPDTISYNSNGNNSPMGIAQINGSNTYAGNTTINGQTSGFVQGITMQVGVSSVGAGSLVTSGPFGKGNLTWAGNSGSPGLLEPFGADRTVGNNLVMGSGFFVTEPSAAQDPTVATAPHNMTLTGNIGIGTMSRTITNDLPSGAVLTLGSASSPATIGAPILSSANAGLVIQSQQAAGNGGGVTVINDVIQNTVTSSLTYLGALTVQNGGTVELMNTNTYTGGSTVKNGALLTTATNFSNGTLVLSSGTLGAALATVLAQSTPGAAGGVTIVPAVSIDSGSSTPTSKLDLTNNGMVVDYPSGGTDPFSTIRGDVINASAVGNYTGGGITSSLAAAVAADSGNTHKTAIGYAEASSLGIVGTGSFLGHTVDDSSVLIRYTLAGDANLDGLVNALDFNALATGYGTTGSANWVQGDYNYDGNVDSNDFALLAANYNDNIANAATSSQPVASLGALVPEPTTMGLVGLSLLALRRRRGK